jgi:hypothetical protein
MKVSLNSNAGVLSIPQSGHNQQAAIVAFIALYFAFIILRACISWTYERISRVLPIVCRWVRREVLRRVITILCRRMIRSVLSILLILHELIRRFGLVF